MGCNDVDRVHLKALCRGEVMLVVTTHPFSTVTWVTAADKELGELFLQPQQ